MLEADGLALIPRQSGSLRAGEPVVVELIAGPLSALQGAPRP
jgi:molybdopterin biosynthesis enzyme